MSAPLLAQHADVSGRVRFRVVRHGWIGDRPVRMGDVIVCGGEAVEDQPTVLVARGVGRPRLGHVRGIRLFGDAGEPCDSDRWRPVGHIIAILRSSTDFADSGAAPTQLDLFAAA